MNKETLIALIDKDINELKTLTQGFSEMSEFPQPLLDLAISKAENLQHMLAELPQSVAVAAPEVQPEPVEEPKQPEAEPVQEEPVVVPEPETVVEEPKEEPQEPEIVAEVQEEVAEKATPEVPAEQSVEPVAEIETPVTETEQTQIVAETIKKAESVVDAFEKGEDHSVAHTIANQPITDLKRAISIADRFRFQRELFANNGELMSTALETINACATYADAEYYMNEKLRLPQESGAMADFLELVKRRFL